MEEELPPPTISTLPDALIQHILLYLEMDLPALGRALCSCATVARVGRDDAVWGSFCASRFGLATASDPSRAPCDSFWHAARAWTKLCMEHGDARLWQKLRALPAISEGARVTLHGLSRDELNGLCGHAVKQLLETGRWEVSLDAGAGDAQSLSLKPENLRVDGGPRAMMAPLWARASETWGVLSAWAAAELPELHATLAPPAKHAEWERFLNECGLPAESLAEARLAPLRVLCAQHDGQHIDFDTYIATKNGLLPGPEKEMDRAQLDRERWLGLGGGYSAYSHGVSVRLLPLQLVAAWSKFVQQRRHEFPGLTPSMLVVAATFNLRKFFLYDASSGELFVCPAQRVEPHRCFVRAVPAATPRGDDLLAWLEELGRRCEAGVYVAEPIGGEREPESRGLSLFPRRGPLLSRAVTRGIEVEASALFCPEQESCIYSIRLRLLPENEEGGMSEEARGFATCQLHSRHWVLSDDNGRDEEVHGDGVVGCYPLLKQGGYRNDRQSRSAHMNVGVPAAAVLPGDECTGVFVYQSMSGRGGMRSFGGELSFVPGSLRQPTGPEFQVRVARFALTDGSERGNFLF